MKIVGTNDSEISIYLLDYFSILHFICGIFGYIITYFLLSVFFIDMFSGFESLFLTYIIVLLGGIFWEIAENTFLIEIKIFRERDYVINSQMDVLLVFSGGILGCYLYSFPMLTVFIIGGLFLFFIVAKIFTKIKFWKK